MFGHFLKAIPDNICRFDKNFSSCLGIQQEDKILVSFPHLTFPDCISLHLVPVSDEDWNALVTESKQLSMKLLEQQRIAWKNLIFPFWLHTNVCVFLKVVSINPSSDFVVLRINTEISFHRTLEQINLGNFLNLNSFGYYQDFSLDNSIDDDFVPSLLIWETFEIFKNLFKYNSQRGDGRTSKFFPINNDFNTLYQILINSTQLKSIVLYASQFRTDGYDLFLNKSNYVFPNGFFYNNIYHRNQDCVITDAFPINGFANNSFPIRACGNTNPLNYLTCIKKYISKESMIKLRHAISAEFAVKNITLRILQEDFEKFGECRIINALKFTLLHLTKEFPFPIRNKQMIRLQIDEIVILAKLYFEISEERGINNNCYYLINQTILNEIIIRIFPTIFLKTDICYYMQYLCTFSQIPKEDLFFGYNSLKLKSKWIIGSFFSPFNQFKNSLALHITSYNSTPRMGRNSFVNFITFLTSKFVPEVLVNSLDGILMKGKRLEIIKSSIEKLFQTDGIAIIYNIEQLLPENNVEQNLNFGNNWLFRLLSSLISARHPNSNKLLFISTSRESQTIQRLLKKEYILFFDYQFVLHPATSQDKLDILRGTFKTHRFVHKR